KFEIKQGIEQSVIDKLDASLKRNTGFIKKCKSIQEDNRLLLVQEFQQLKLSKYLSEVSSAIFENKFKNSQDVLAAAHIITLMHHRYKEFYAMIREGFLKVFSSFGDSTMIVKQRSFLRLFAELVIIGTEKNTKSLLQLLKKMTTNDEKEFLYLTTIVTFVKHYGNEVLPCVEKIESCLSDETRAEIFNCVNQYFDKVCACLVSSQKALFKMERYNNDFIHTKGELTEKMKANHEELVKKVDKLQTNGQILAEGLKRELPVVKEAEEQSKVVPIISENQPLKEQKEDLDSIFEDEDARIFYEKLLDLKLAVPSSLLGQSEEEINSDEMKPETTSIDEFIEKLPSLVNRDLIDQAAVNFCYLNSKSNRSKLVKAIINVPRTRLDLLPYYSRLIATLNPYFPEIGQEIITYLDDTSRGIMRKNHPNILETKIKIVRFQGELIKFKILPTYAAFNDLKYLLDDFVGINVDVVANLIEVCGRYLCLKQETSEKFNSLLDIMMKKKQSGHFDNRQTMLIDNSFFLCHPPERNVYKLKEKDPLQLYLFKLFYHDLSESTASSVLKKLLMFPPEYYNQIKKKFLKIWKFKYSNIEALASLAAGFAQHYTDFGVWLIDAFFEQIIMDLESNNFKNNQKRVACMKYLGELYNYQLIDAEVILTCLSFVICFGHQNGLPVKDSLCQFESPNDLFRIRLCCTLLQTCGIYLEGPGIRKKLDAFLIFLQYYCFTKSQISMDVEFLLQDVLQEIRPNSKLISSHEEAIQALISLQSSNNNSPRQSIAFQKSEPSPSNPLKHKKDDESEEENEEDFEKLFSQMMNDSSDKRDRKSQFDAPVPRVKASKDSSNGNLSFSLMTKKGTRQQTRKILVPMDSSLAKEAIKHQEKERKEQMEMKKLVLNSQQHDDSNNESGKTLFANLNKSNIYE
ncbi:ARM repeat-containing protein, partial [Rozella allomycis CSF55]